MDEAITLSGPYLGATSGASIWVSWIVGHDFYHGNDEPNAPRVFHNSRTLSEYGVITMPYLKNLDRTRKSALLLIGMPLKIIGAEASPVRGSGVLNRGSIRTDRLAGELRHHDGFETYNDNGRDFCLPLRTRAR